MSVLFTRRGEPPVGASTNINFEFTIAGTTYYAEQGMTWAEWVESDYNTGGFKLTFAGTSYRVALSSIEYVSNTSSTDFVKSTDEITAGHAYYIYEA